MDIQHLYEFSLIAKYQSITKAAEILHVSPAALSARLKCFERNLNIQLIHHSKTLTVTPEGERFLQYADEILEIYKEMIMQLPNVNFESAQTDEYLHHAVSSDLLYEFLVLSKLLNFSQAASRLFISQPVLSRHIQHVENALNCPLLQRSTHAVTLTDAGNIVAGYAPKLIEQCSRALQLMQYKHLSMDGHIRIACAPEIAYAKHIHTYIQNFMHNYPSIHVELDVQAEGTPVEMLEQYDCLLTPCDFPNYPDTIQRLHLYSHRTFVIVPEDHPFCRKTTLFLRDLTHETIIVPFFNELFGPYASNWLLAEKYTHGQVYHIPAVNLATALMQVVLHKGILIAPGYVGKMLPDTLKMIEIKSQESRFDEFIYINHTGNNPAAKLFFDDIYFP